MEYLSDEWFDAVGSVDDIQADEEPALRLGYSIDDAPGGEVVYRVLLPAGVVERCRAEADVGFAMTYDTALAIYEGTCSPQECVLDGRIVVTGDPTALLDQAEALASLPEVFARLRARAESADA